MILMHDAVTARSEELRQHGARAIPAPVALPSWVARLPEGPRELRRNPCQRLAADRRPSSEPEPRPGWSPGRCAPRARMSPLLQPPRSEEHTSELQSRQYLVCRL